MGRFWPSRGRFGHQHGPFWTRIVGPFGSWAVLVISPLCR